eukprot:TRINITY_DN2239_c0_g1_i1.p1 TRINITY_DN2239_c0_g1~~TRINITY_DN2239_c0_g1_i1.p1  ORF type:complete len:285 (+),score=30.03 TRINITY_DN2239_c0_g1_i1:475-1329(+)
MALQASGNLLPNELPVTPVRPTTRAHTDDEDDCVSPQRPRAKRRKTKFDLAASAGSNKAKHDKPRGPRLLLNDALSKLEKENSFDGWSDARMKAWRQKDKHPNAYYYRFNDPNEAQKNGAWSPEEKALFFKRKDEVGITQQWGIFSMTIPGRVGYQCSNFYRQLVKTGELADPNYTYVDGKLKYENKSKAPKAESAKRKREVRKEETSLLHVNPLPDFMDPITCDAVERPAISPGGVVLGYNTWMHCIQSNGRCPVTQVPISRRDLVLLTPLNIAEHRAHIVNL